MSLDVGKEGRKVIVWYALYIGRFLQLGASCIFASDPEKELIMQTPMRIHISLIFRLGVAPLECHSHYSTISLAGSDINVIPITISRVIRFRHGSASGP